MCVHDSILDTHRDTTEAERLAQSHRAGRLGGYSAPAAGPSRVGAAVAGSLPQMGAQSKRLLAQGAAAPQKPGPRGRKPETSTVGLSKGTDDDAAIISIGNGRQNLKTCSFLSLLQFTRKDVLTIFQQLEAENLSRCCSLQAPDFRRDPRLGRTRWAPSTPPRPASQAWPLSEACLQLHPGPTGAAAPRRWPGAPCAPCPSQSGPGIPGLQQGRRKGQATGLSPRHPSPTGCRDGARPTAQGVVVAVDQWEESQTRRPLFL